jgi:nitrogen fixation protein FixH
MGSSGEMDKVTLVFEGGEEVTLDQAWTHGSNYAHSNTYEYEAEDTINQIAMIIAEKNKLPKMIRYSHESWDSWSGQRSERYEAEWEFSYEEVEGEIMAAAKWLGKWDDLIEIWNALIEDLEKNRIEEVKNRFVNLLMSPPVTDYHNWSLGESWEQDNVKLVFADGEEITLDQAWTHGSNYAHSNTYEYEAENTINQIAMIIAKKGEEPKQVYYWHSEHNSWEGSTHYSIKQEHTFEYKEVEREIMEAAKWLGKWDDLIEIWNSLIEDLEKNRIEEVKNRFVNLLMSPPVTDYHNNGSCKMIR